MRVENQKDLVSAAASGEAKTVIIKEGCDEVKIVCDMCGYPNPAHTAICKKCSNYLEGDVK